MNKLVLRHFPFGDHRFRQSSDLSLFNQLLYNIFSTQRSKVAAVTFLMQNDVFPSDIQFLERSV